VLGYVGVFWRVLLSPTLLCCCCGFLLLHCASRTVYHACKPNSSSTTRCTHTQLTEKHISSLLADKHRHTQKQERKKEKKPTQRDRERERERERERDAHAHVFVCKKGGCFGWHYRCEKDALRLCLHETQLEREENRERERKSLGGGGVAETHID
jgi:hypothetical protein